MNGKRIEEQVGRDSQNSWIFFSSHPSWRGREKKGKAGGGKALVYNVESRKGRTGGVSEELVLIPIENSYQLGAAIPERNNEKDQAG